MRKPSLNSNPLGSLTARRSPLDTSNLEDLQEEALVVDIIHIINPLLELV